MLSGRVEFLGAPLDLVSMEQAVEIAEEAIGLGVPRQHGCLSSSVVAAIQRDEGLRAALWSFDLVTADGQGVVWGGRLLGRSVPERVTGIDLMEALLVRADARGYSVFLLGAEPRVLAQTAAVIRGRYSKIRIAGIQHGYFPRTRESEVVDEIASSGAQFLFVALSSPEKELFLSRNRDRLRVKFAMGVGGTFDVIAGRRKRAPAVVQRIGLEWAFRLGQEPRRLMRRFLVGNSRFLGLLAREVVRLRLRRFRTLLARRGSAATRGDSR
jgi:N-acetylglucosaminyldiphosphoundecaprenol N-acetyl-beta-D-mannosaminyltransferase